MDDASWDYILAHAWTPAQRKDLSDARTITLPRHIEHAKTRPSCSPSST